MACPKRPRRHSCRSGCNSSTPPARPHRRRGESAQHVQGAGQGRARLQRSQVEAWIDGPSAIGSGTACRIRPRRRRRTASRRGSFGRSRGRDRRRSQRLPPRPSWRRAANMRSSRCDRSSWSQQAHVFKAATASRSLSPRPHIFITTMWSAANRAGFYRRRPVRDQFEGGNTLQARTEREGLQCLGVGGAQSTRPDHAARHAPGRSRGPTRRKSNAPRRSGHRHPSK